MHAIFVERARLSSGIVRLQWESCDFVSMLLECQFGPYLH